MAAALPIGTHVAVEGDLRPVGLSQHKTVKGTIAWCEATPSGYKAGIIFDKEVIPELDGSETASELFSTDHYEVLQLSPDADVEVVQRVFRVLAQRYHPDNRESGNAARFRRILEAYTVLNDPAQRAAFDAARIDQKSTHWRIFNRDDAHAGVSAEKRKRHALLALLYARRVVDVEQPYVTIHDVEQTLGCPREHLHFSLWYLKENGLIGRTDNGRYFLTAKGVDSAEHEESNAPPEHRLLTASAST